MSENIHQLRQKNTVPTRAGGVVTGRSIRAEEIANLDMRHIQVIVGKILNSSNTAYVDAEVRRLREGLAHQTPATAWCLAARDTG